MHTEKEGNGQDNAHGDNNIFTEGPVKWAHPAAVHTRKDVCVRNKQYRERKGNKQTLNKSTINTRCMDGCSQRSRPGHIDRQTDRQTERQTDRQTDR